MRVPYAPYPVPTSTPAEAAAIQHIVDRRGARGLQPLDRAMLHSLPMAAGWSNFYGALRTQTSITGDVRETAICTVAVETRAAYEWPHHAPIARAAGLDEAALQSIRDGTGDRLSEKLRAVMVYAQQMTRAINVAPELVEALKQWFTTQEVVEITMVIAAYNCTSRFLVALDVGEMNDVPVETWK
ncbi:carboxymuconolactone decarboxylase [Niveomyces insectorum RCEF 264]|uniref:Carboxymuconolactone decarboxylase n=1 Tax=Niveomyces insectorum RCEF 264 TaxID=1081102 RepID=A0A162KAP5_9HYPO|nr:carboxymuconolactone decarboxylase [Niveomyces insectorum RCEF 264]